MRFLLVAKMTTPTRFYKKNQIVKLGKCDSWNQVRKIVRNNYFGCAKTGAISRKFVSIFDREKGICIRIGLHSDAARCIWDIHDSFVVFKVTKLTTEGAYLSRIIHEPMFYLSSYDDTVDYIIGHKLQLKYHYFVHHCTKYNIKPLIKEHQYLEAVI